MANAWGIGDRETRITYNFNTGNFFGDVALEILTDPLNWFSLGSKALGGAAINTVGDVVEETVENTVKTNIDDVSKVLLKNVSKESADDFADVTTKFVTKKVLKQFDGDITFDTIKRYLKKTTIEEFENISKELLDYGLRNDIFEQTVKSAMKDTVASSAKALRWYAAANAFKDSVEAVDTALTHVAWAPVYYPFQAIKKSGLAKGIVNRIHNKLVSLLADYVKTDDIINPKKAYDYISANIFSESEYYFGDLINKNKNFLDKLGISAYALQEQYLAMFRTMSYDELQKLTMDDIRMKFIEYLASHNNALIKELMLNADELKFLEAMSIGPIMIRKAELETLMHTNSMQIDRVIKNINSKQTLIQKLKLLDSQILMYNNQHYGIEHLPDFIRKVIINSDSIPYQDRVLIKQLIDDLGLNPKNYKQVAEFLKNNNTKAIVKIIKNTQNSPRFIDDKLLNEFIQSSTKYNQEKIIPALKVFFEKDLICKISKKKVNKFVRLFKYVTTVGLTITFVVVLVILLPMVGFNFNYLLFQGAMPYHHLICPILSFITFIYYDDLGKYYKKDSYYPLGVTLIYGFTLIVLNILRKIDGPYPFLKVYNQTFIVSVLWFILIIGMGYLISIIVLKFRNQPQVHLKK